MVLLRVLHWNLCCKILPAFFETQSYLTASSNYYIDSRLKYNSFGTNWIGINYYYFFFSVTYRYKFYFLFLWTLVAYNNLRCFNVTVNENSKRNYNARFFFSSTLIKRLCKQTGNVNGVFMLRCCTASKGRRKIDCFVIL